jgi:hypothetical protein
MNLKRIAAGAAIAGALGFTAVGLGAGTANAAPPAPAVAGWQQDHGGHWGHRGDGGDWNNGGGYWGDRGNWGPGPGWAPCVTGPFGFVTFCP